MASAGIDRRQHAAVAQLVEHFLGKEEVGSSILLEGSPLVSIFGLHRLLIRVFVFPNRLFLETF